MPTSQGLFGARKALGRIRKSPDLIATPTRPTGVYSIQGHEYFQASEEEVLWPPDPPVSPEAWKKLKMGLLENPSITYRES